MHVPSVFQYFFTKRTLSFGPPLPSRQTVSITVTSLVLMRFDSPMVLSTFYPPAYAYVRGIRPASIITTVPLPASARRSARAQSVPVPTRILS